MNLATPFRNTRFKNDTILSNLLLNISASFTGFINKAGNSEQNLDCTIAKTTSFHRTQKKIVYTKYC